ncbi:reverse transcriptase family protein [Acetobacter sp. P5B1]|uniref:reverse transcriptase family protein n=1 Tax=Acetobacter sp. P5B1 TaxID=2762620 RepID=UPI001C050C82|nr:reverse transcriptase family protein [Acetobacter sp. P5B1]
MWSPQRYRELGLEKGVDPEVVDRSAEAISDFLDSYATLPPILTLGHLAARTGIPYYKLRKIVVGQRTLEYQYFWIRKRSGGRRLISVPEPDLMHIQRWIAGHLLARQPVHRASAAFRPKASISKCARQHCEARWLIKLDISGFFGSISEIQVYRVFRRMGYAPLVAFELARLCTHAPANSKRYQQDSKWLVRKCESRKFYTQWGIGYLPQGAPSSPMLSNLIMVEADKKIAKLATNQGLTYTRYSDDITFSTTRGYDRERAKKIVRDTTAILRRMGLAVNDKKTRIIPPGGRKIVLGLLVDGSHPKLTRDFRDRLRQHLYYLQKFGPEAHQLERGFDTVSGLYRHVRGLIDFAKSIDANYAARVQKKFEAIKWSLDFSD